MSCRKSQVSYGALQLAWFGFQSSNIYALQFSKFIAHLQTTNVWYVQL